MIKEKIKKWIEQILKADVDFVLEHPADLKNGDFSTNIAMVLAKKEKQNPALLANDFGRALSENKIPEVEKVEVVGGFINFYLSKEFFEESIKEILGKGEEYGKNDNLKGQKIIVEFTDPNPFKEFHIGHLMSNTIGESVSRIINFCGSGIKRANWQGDVGIHVATAVWGIIDLNLDIETAKPSDLGRAYAHGSLKSKESEEIKNEIVEINKQIFSRNDQKINHIYDLGRKISLDHFEIIYDRLGTKFDHYFFESKEGVEGKPIVETHLEDGIFENSDGAIIFRGEKYGLHTRVFINSNGLPTYEAKELGLNKKKFEVEKNLNRSIIVTGNEIKDYFKVLLKVISLIFPEIAEKTMHLSHGMLRLPQGKMSSRTGNVITAESLIDQVKEKIFEKIKDREFSDVEKDKVAEIVAIGAIKYSILRQAIGGDIIFDFEKSISFEGDSGPYLQYTCVRANSVLEKSQNYNTQKKPRGTLDTPRSDNFEITELERHLYRFPEVVKRAGKEYAPHHIVTYLTELTSAFNSFYAKEKIIDPSDHSSAYKLTLTSAVSHILKNGLHLLGIKVPERM